MVSRDDTTDNNMKQCSLPFSSVLNLSWSVSIDILKKIATILILYFGFIYLSSLNRSFSCPPLRLILYSFSLFLLTVFHLLPIHFKIQVKARRQSWTQIENDTYFIMSLQGI